MKKIFAWIKKLVAIGAKVSTNPKVKAELEAADKILNAPDSDSR
jgi:hypothetical protein